MFIKYIRKTHPLHGLNVICYQCEFCVEEYQDQNYQTLGIDIPENFSRAIRKRKAEYLAGRYMAKLALQDANANCVQIKTEDKRAPVWPENTIGAITHNKNTAICAVASTRNLTHLGIDIAPYISPEVANKVRRSIINEREYEVLTQSNLPAQHALTLAFSAKESLFKALFYDVGDYFGFSAARTTEVDSLTKMVTMELAEDLTEHWRKGAEFRIRYQFAQAAIFTFLGIERA